jgi:hypothetical protein
VSVSDDIALRGMQATTYLGLPAVPMRTELTKEQNYDSKIPPTIFSYSETYEAAVSISTFTFTYSQNLIFGVINTLASMTAATDEKDIITFIPDEYLFQSYVTLWRDERGYSSSSTQIAACPSYQRIIGMGRRALPLIFRQLKSEGDKPENWFWALRAITGKDPVPNDLRGNRREIAKIWLRWGEQNGYVSN